MITIDRADIEKTIELMTVDIELFYHLLIEKLATPTIKSIKFKRKNPEKTYTLITRRNNPVSLLNCTAVNEWLSLQTQKYNATLLEQTKSHDLALMIELCCVTQVKTMILIGVIFDRHAIGISRWKNWVRFHTTTDQMNYWLDKLLSSNGLLFETILNQASGLYGKTVKSYDLRVVQIQERRLRAGRKPANAEKIVTASAKSPISLLFFSLITLHLIIFEDREESLVYGLKMVFKISRVIDTLWMAQKGEINRKNYSFRREELNKIRLTKRASSMAMAKHASDPKQGYKAEIKELWIEWQALNNPNERYRSAAAFANDMMSKYHDPHDSNTPQSARVIERWCTEWKKEQKNTHPA